MSAYAGRRGWLGGGGGAAGGRLPAGCWLLLAAHVPLRWPLWTSAPLLMAAAAGATPHTLRG